MNTFSRGLACGLFLVFSVSAFANSQRDRSFDSDWRFLRGDADGAESPEFNDSAWRTLGLPHDWSIEDLPADQSATNRIGPFDTK